MECVENSLTVGESTEFLWARDYSPESRGHLTYGDLTYKIQPFQGRTFVVSNRVLEIDPSNGDVTTEFNQPIGILSTGLYSLHPEIIGMDETHLYSVVNDHYQNGEIWLYSLGRSDGEEDRGIDIASSIETITKKLGHFRDMVVFEGNLFLNLVDGRLVRVNNDSRSYSKVNRATEEAVRQNIWCNYYDFFDIHSHILPEKGTLKLDDLSLNVRGVGNLQKSGSGRWPSGVIELRSTRHIEDIVGEIKVPGGISIDTFTRNQDSLYIAVGPVVHHFKFGSKK